MKKKTIYQIIQEIHKNANESILTFEGFNSQRDTELKNELLWSVYEKYGKDRGSINKLIAKSGKSGEVEAYFLMRYGHITPPKSIKERLSWIDTYLCNNYDVNSESERCNNHKKAIQILLNRGKEDVIRILRGKNEVEED